ncbi:hypothetical protein DFH09DRAFT_1084948 [Mycena vulgaris]|nr:hypothetical protein DFH09DRAFT_1084948 [Mycena vulgaris]
MQERNMDDLNDFVTRNLTLYIWQLGGNSGLGLVTGGLKAGYYRFRSLTWLSIKVENVAQLCNYTGPRRFSFSYCNIGRRKSPNLLIDCHQIPGFDSVASLIWGSASIRYMYPTSLLNRAYVHPSVGCNIFNATLSGTWMRAIGFGNANRNSTMRTRSENEVHRRKPPTSQIRCQILREPRNGPLFTVLRRLMASLFRFTNPHTQISLQFIAFQSVREHPTRRIVLAEQRDQKIPEDHSIRAPTLLRCIAPYALTCVRGEKGIYTLPLACITGHGVCGTLHRARLREGGAPSRRRGREGTHEEVPSEGEACKRAAPLVCAIHPARRLEAPRDRRRVLLMHRQQGAHALQVPIHVKVEQRLPGRVAHDARLSRLRWERRRRVCWSCVGEVGGGHVFLLGHLDVLLPEDVLESGFRAARARLGVVAVAVRAAPPAPLARHGELIRERRRDPSWTKVYLRFFRTSGFKSVASNTSAQCGMDTECHGRVADEGRAGACY